MTPYEKEMWGIAHSVASNSKDPSTKVGAVAAKHKRCVATGRNGFPAGVPDIPEHYLDRGMKLEIVNHAEINLISSRETSLYGADLFVTYPVCNRCAGAIINSGVVRVFCKAAKIEDREWYWKFRLACAMFDVAGVEVYTLNQNDEFEKYDCKISVSEAYCNLIDNV